MWGLIVSIPDLYPLSYFNCASLLADLFLICYERDFMVFLSDNNQADVIKRIVLSKALTCMNLFMH